MSMADPTILLAVGLSVGLLVLLLIGVSVYFLLRRQGQRRYQQLVSTMPPFPACTAPVLLTSQGCRSRPDEIPFFLPPVFKPRHQHVTIGIVGEEEEEEERKGQRGINAHRGSLTVGSWYPIGTVRAGLYCLPVLSEVVEPPSGSAVRLCFAVEYRHGSEQLLISLLRLGNLPPRFHSNSTLAELLLLPDDRRPRQAKARCRGRDPEFNNSFVFQVSGVCVSQSTLSVCVLSVDQDGKHHAVGKVLFPLEGELGEAGRVLWRDLEDDTQCSGLGDVQVSLNYSPSLQRLTVVVLRARGLQLLSDTGVYFQVDLQVHTQVVKTRLTSVVKGGVNPSFNQRMTFKLRPHQLDEACLSLELQQLNTLGPGPLGLVVLGPFMYARGPQLQHWRDMVNTPQELVKQWHGLGRAT